MNSFQVKQLAELCRPIVDFLQKNCTPHETVIITDSGFKMTSDVAGMPLDNPYKDTKPVMQKLIEEYIVRELEKKRHENGTKRHENGTKRHENGTPFDNMVKRMIERSRQ